MEIPSGHSEIRTAPERFYSLSFFVGEGAEGKGGLEDIHTKLGSDVLTFLIKNANTSFKPCLEDDPHWPPRQEKS